MNPLYKIAGAMLHRFQNLAIYRSFGRRVVSGVTLREASEADQRAVQRWLDPNSDPTQELRPNSNVTNWVAEVHGQLAGFVQLVRHPPEHAPYVGYWLFTLYTKPRWQGLGIGEALSRAVIERARSENAPMLDLVVYEDNVRAVRLYRKLGFEICTIPELEPQLESERVTSGRRRVVMRKHLAAQP
jgi:ribosomal protein S18 acetylase RimI-like enzyme